MISTVLRCILDTDLEILASIGGKLLHRNARNGDKSWFEVQFHLNGRDQSTPKTRAILTKVPCTSGPDFGILSWTCDKQSRGQAHNRHTHTHTQTLASTVTGSQNWPRVMIYFRLGNRKWHFITHSSGTLMRRLLSPKLKLIHYLRTIYGLILNTVIKVTLSGRDSVSNHQPHDCLLNRLFRRRSKKTSKLRATGLCAGKSPGTGEFPAQMASNAENVSIWWRYHVGG